MVHLMVVPVYVGRAAAAVTATTAAAAAAAPAHGTGTVAAAIAVLAVSRWVVHRSRGAASQAVEPDAADGQRANTMITT